MKSYQNQVRSLRKIYAVDHLREMFVKRNNEYLFANIRVKADKSLTDFTAQVWLGFQVLTNSEYLLDRFRV